MADKDKLIKCPVCRKGTLFGINDKVTKGEISAICKWCRAKIRYDVEKDCFTEQIIKIKS